MSIFSKNLYRLFLICSFVVLGGDNVGQEAFPYYWGTILQASPIEPGAKASKNETKTQSRFFKRKKKPKKVKSGVKVFFGLFFGVPLFMLGLYGIIWSFSVIGYIDPWGGLGIVVGVIPGSLLLIVGGAVILYYVIKILLSLLAYQKDIEKKAGRKPSKTKDAPKTKEKTQKLKGLAADLAELEKMAAYLNRVDEHLAKDKSNQLLIQKRAKARKKLLKQAKSLPSKLPRLRKEIEELKGSKEEQPRPNLPKKDMEKEISQKEKQLKKIEGVILHKDDVEALKEYLIDKKD